MDKSNVKHTTDSYIIVCLDLKILKTRKERKDLKIIYAKIQHEKQTAVKHDGQQ